MIVSDHIIMTDHVPGHIKEALFHLVVGEKYVLDLKRSRTMGVIDGHKKEEKLSAKNAELRKMIRRAKREAEKAIKVGHIT